MVIVLPMAAFRLLIFVIVGTLCKLLRSAAIGPLEGPLLPLTISGFPSPSKSLIDILVPGALLVKSSFVAKEEVEIVPGLEMFRNTVMVWGSKEAAATISGFPSPFISLIATE